MGMGIYKFGFWGGFIKNMKLFHISMSKIEQALMVLLGYKSIRLCTGGHQPYIQRPKGARGPDRAWKLGAGGAGNACLELQSQLD